MLPTAQEIQIILPVLSVAFLALSFFRPIYGTISYFIILNAKLGDMYPILGAIRFELVAAVVVLATCIISGRGFHAIFDFKNRLNRSLWIIFAVGMLSVPLSVDVQESWTHGGYSLFKLALFYFMIICSITERADIDKLVWATILITVWIAYEPIVNYINGIGMDHGYGTVASGRFGVATGHVALANTTNQVIPLTFYWALTRKNKQKIFGWVCFSILIVCVVVTKSRGGFIGLLAFGSGVIYFSENKKKSLLAVLILIVVSLPLAGNEYLDHMATIRKGISGSRSSSDRYMGLVNGISMMIKRPVIGVGIGCYARARQQYFNYYFYSHNLYGELFGELGLSSIAWFYWVYMIFRKAGDVSRKLDDRDLDSEDKRVLHYMLTGIKLSLFVRLVIGNFSHCAFIWFWFLMTGLVYSTEFVINSKHSGPQRQNVKVSSPSTYQRISYKECSC